MHPRLILPVCCLLAACGDRPAADHHEAATATATRPAEAARKPAAKEAAHHAVTPGPAPVEALARISAGNARFVTGRRSRSSQAADDAAERGETAKGQHPFAAVLTCADSRLPPELIFDQSVGDLFVVRNAGNVAEPIGEGSLEYAVEHLGVRLLVVLGHSACGAVTAVSGASESLPGHLADIQRQMPGLAEFASEARKTQAPDQVLIAAVQRNALDQANALLRESPVLRKAVAQGQATVVPAVYDLGSGVVEFLPPLSASGDPPANEAH
jgi:carbonic anhydrase